MSEGWSKDFFERTREAVRTLEHQKLVEEKMHEAVLALPSGTNATIGHSGHRVDQTKRIDELIDHEAGSGLAWAVETIEAFKALMLELRSSTRGVILQGTFVAELYYLDCLSLKQVAATLELSVSACKEHKKALCEYLDFEGVYLIPENVR